MVVVAGRPLCSAEAEGRGEDFPRVGGRDRSRRFSEGGARMAENSTPIACRVFGRRGKGGGEKRPPLFCRHRHGWGF